MRFSVSWRSEISACLWQGVSPVNSALEQRAVLVTERLQRGALLRPKTVSMVSLSLLSHCLQSRCCFQTFHILQEKSSFLIRSVKEIQTIWQWLLLLAIATLVRQSKRNPCLSLSLARLRQKKLCQQGTPHAERRDYEDLLLKILEAMIVVLLCVSDSWQHFYTEALDWSVEESLQPVLCVMGCETYCMWLCPQCSWGNCVYTGIVPI